MILNVLLAVFRLEMLNAKDLVQLRRSLANIPNFKKNVMALGTDDAISFAKALIPTKNYMIF